MMALRQQQLWSPPTAASSDERYSIGDAPRIMNTHSLQRPLVFLQIPIMALTATATPRVQSEIMSNLGLRNPLVAKTSFNRWNLHYSVSVVDRKTPSDSLPHRGKRSSHEKTPRSGALV